MYDLTDDEDTYNYLPNDLAKLSSCNPEKYRRMVKANTGKSVEQFESDNLEWAKDCLAQQLLNKKGAT